MDAIIITHTALPEEPVDKSPPKPKAKRVQTEQQKLNFIKCLEARKLNIQMRKQQKAEQAH